MRKKCIDTDNKELCVGCGACISICPRQAITMKRDEKGFDFPCVETDQCLLCGKCIDVCPIDKELLRRNEPKQVWAFRRKSEVMKSQSGGAFFTFAENVIGLGGVVFGVRMHGLQAEYCFVDKPEDLNQLRKSKYVQAASNRVMIDIQKFLQSGRWVLVSGTPCFIAGLNNFLKLNGTNMQRLITCDVICHGVPSPGVYGEYMEILEDKYGAIKQFDFRDKMVAGWRGSVVSFITKKKKIISDNYVKLFYSDLLLRESCYHCKYADTNRVADITIGDFWGIEKVTDLFADDKGCSVILVNNQRTKWLIEKIKDAGILYETNLQACLQSNLQHPTNKPKEYQEFWKYYSEHGLERALEKYCQYRSKNDKSVWKYKVHLVIHKVLNKFRRR